MRHLQLRRNGLLNIYPNREAAKQYINGTLINSVTDGEPIIARYEDSGDTVCTMIGYAYVKNDTEKSIYIVDATEILEEIDRVEKAAGIDADGNYVQNIDKRFIESALNLNEADVKLNDVLVNTVDGVGLKLEDGTYVKQTGRYTSADTTMADSITSLDTIAKNSVDAVGLLEADGTYVKSTDRRFIQTATTVKNAMDKTNVILETAVDAVGLANISGEFVKPIGNYASRGNTVKSSLEHLDTIATNTIVGVGLNGENGKYITPTGKYVNNSVDVKGALENLNNELEDRLKIDHINKTDSISLKIDGPSGGTPTLLADLILAESSGTTGTTTNIIKTNTNGVFANVYLSYDGVDNSLTFDNGVESKKMPLNAGSIIDGMVYKPTDETLVITYHTTSSTDQKTVVIPLADLITEYKFVNTTTDITYDGGKGNVLFKIDRTIDGQSEIKADINIFDCGEY